MIAMGKLPAGDIRIAKNEIAAKTGEPVSALSTFETEKVEIVHPAYPAGEFRINDTRVVFVKKGTSYLSVAQQNNISLGRLFEFNEMQEKVPISKTLRGLTI